MSCGRSSEVAEVTLIINLKNKSWCLVEFCSDNWVQNAHEINECSIKHTLKHNTVLRRGLGSRLVVVWRARAQTPITIHSHHLSPVHRVLMRVMVWVPVTKTVHVIVWVHLGSFVRHGDLPELGQPGRAGRNGAGAVEMFSLWSASMLHDLFILGALILKPYFHLKGRKWPLMSLWLKISSNIKEKILRRAFLWA